MTDGRAAGGADESLSGTTISGSVLQSMLTVVSQQLELALQEQTSSEQLAHVLRELIDLTKAMDHLQFEFLAARREFATYQRELLAHQRDLAAYQRDLGIPTAQQRAEGGAADQRNIDQITRPEPPSSPVPSETTLVADEAAAEEESSGRELSVVSPNLGATRVNTSWPWQGGARR